MPRERQDEPEDNAEQREPDQAQDVAQDALYGAAGEDVFDSEKPDAGPADDDSGVQDTVDLMKSMVRSGRVDMGAYAGEPLMDDGDADMPGTPAGPALDGDDDMMGGGTDSAVDMDEIADTGEDPLAGIVSDAPEDDEDREA